MANCDLARLCFIGRLITDLSISSLLIYSLGCSLRSLKPFLLQMHLSLDRCCEAGSYEEDYC